MLRHVTAAAVSLILLLGPTMAANGDITVKSDIAYGELPRQKLDIYIPATVTADTPIFVFFYSSAWQGGSKEDLRSASQNFAKAGIIFVAPNFRLWPEAVFPNFVEDSALAVAFAWRNFRKEDGGQRPLFVGGWSSGAYNAAMVSINQSYLAANGVPGDAVTALIGLVGPYEGGLCAGIRCEDRFPEAGRSQWSVADFLDANDPPMLLIVAEGDRFVAPSHHEGLAIAAERAGVKVSIVEVAYAGHSGVLSQFKNPGTTVWESVAAFMADILKR